MRWRWWWQPPCLLRSTILNLKSGDALSGALWSTHGSWFTLRKASALKAGQPPMPIDGEVVVHRDQIEFIQVLP